MATSAEQYDANAKNEQTPGSEPIERAKKTEPEDWEKSAEQTAIDNFVDNPVLYQTHRRMDELRKFFFLFFNAEMPSFVHFERYSSSQVIFFKDQQGALNQIQIVSYSAPTDEDQHAPLLLRLAINHYSLMFRGDLAQKLNCAEHAACRCRTEITILPRQIPEFAKWIAEVFTMLDSPPRLIPPEITAPPCTCYFGSKGYPTSNYIWSVEALAEYLHHNGQSMPNHLLSSDHLDALNQ